MATDTISALGAGSGVDIKALATSLVEAERAPRKAVIDKSIAKSQGGISGYSALKFVLGDLKTAFDNLKDQSDFNSITPRVSQASAISISASATASAGSHSVTVTNLAKPQRSISGSNLAGFAATNTQLNAGAAFSLVLSKGNGPAPVKTFTLGSGAPSTASIAFSPVAKGQAVTVNGLTFTAAKAMTATDMGEIFAGLSSTVSTAALNVSLSSWGTFSGSFAAGYTAGTNSAGVVVLTSSTNGAADITAPTTADTMPSTISVAATASTPAGVVAAINAANLGLSAQLINTGIADAPFRIMVTGQTGTLNNFTLTSQTTAGGAVTGLDFGSKLQSAENAALTVNGVPILSSSNRVTDAIAGTTLELFTTTTGAASIEMTHDATAIKTKIEALVTAYNDATSMLGVVSDPKSTVTTYGATMVGNSIVGQVRSQMRAMITGNSDAPAGGLSAMRDLGLSIDNAGTLVLDSAKLNTVLKTKFESAVTLLSANQENQSIFSVATRGIAGAASKKLTDMLDVKNALTTQSTGLTTKIAGYQKELAKLETRMATLLARYNKQFSAMESLVGETKSLKTGLTSTFEGMMATYTNK